jgi:hypothetical protein
MVIDCKHPYYYVRNIVYCIVFLYGISCAIWSTVYSELKYVKPLLM